VYENPYSSSTRWLRGNLHGHTCCGRFMDVTESAPMYASLGYDFMAITDHNLAPDEAQWKAWQDQIPIVLIPGEENGSTDHILELGVFAVTPTDSNAIEHRARSLTDAGGFVAPCHPQEYTWGAENVRLTAGVAHAFEIYNGLRERRGRDESANVELWDEILTDGKRMSVIATDDFHCQYSSPGLGWVCVQVDESTEVTWQLLVEQMKAGAFYASTGPEFEQVLFEDARLTVRCDKHVQEIAVIGPGGRQIAGVEGQQLEWVAQPELTYFRVEARAGIKRAWSQPFYGKS